MQVHCACTQIIPGYDVDMIRQRFVRDTKTLDIKTYLTIDINQSFVLFTFHLAISSV